MLQYCLTNHSINLQTLDVTANISDNSWAKNNSLTYRIFQKRLFLDAVAGTFLLLTSLLAPSLTSFLIHLVPSHMWRPHQRHGTKLAYVLALSVCLMTLKGGSYTLMLLSEHLFSTASLPSRRPRIESIFKKFQSVNMYISMHLMEQ